MNLKNLYKIRRLIKTSKRIFFASGCSPMCGQHEKKKKVAQKEKTTSSVFWSSMTCLEVFKKQTWNKYHLALHWVPRLHRIGGNKQGPEQKTKTLTLLFICLFFFSQTFTAPQTFTAFEKKNIPFVFFFRHFVHGTIGYGFPYVSFLVGSWKVFFFIWRFEPKQKIFFFQSFPTQNIFKKFVVNKMLQVFKGHYSHFIIKIVQILTWVRKYLKMWIVVAELFRVRFLLLSNPSICLTVPLHVLEIFLKGHNHNLHLKIIRATSGTCTDTGMVRNIWKYELWLAIRLTGPVHVIKIFLRV